MLAMLPWVPASSQNCGDKNSIIIATGYNYGSGTRSMRKGGARVMEFSPCGKMYRLMTD